MPRPATSSSITRIPGEPQPLLDPQPNAGLPGEVQVVDPRLAAIRAGEEAAAAETNALQGKVTHPLRGTPEAAVASLEAQNARLEQQMRQMQSQIAALTETARQSAPVIPQPLVLPTMDEAIADQEARVAAGEAPNKVLTKDGWYAHPLYGIPVAELQERQLFKKIATSMAAQSSISETMKAEQALKARKATADTADRNE